MCVGANGLITVKESSTCAHALELMEQNDMRVLPVVDEAKKLVGTISLMQLGSYFLPRMRAPLEMRKIKTSLTNIIKALKAQVINAVNPDVVEDMFVRVGAMDVLSFAQRVSDFPYKQSIIIVGNRWDIQQRSISIGVRLVVVTGDSMPSEDTVERCTQCGVSFISSPFDSATTAWILRTAAVIDNMIVCHYQFILFNDIMFVLLRNKLQYFLRPLLIY